MSTTSPTPSCAAAEQPGLPRPHLQHRRLAAGLAAGPGRHGGAAVRRQPAHYTTREFPADRARIDIGSYHADDSAFRTATGWRPRVGAGGGHRPHAGLVPHAAGGLPMIPQANPGAGYRAHKPEIDAAVGRALASGWYILGERAARLRGRVRRLARRRRRGRLRQRHRRDRAGAAGRSASDPAARS